MLKRIFNKEDEILERERRKEMKFPFDLEDLTPVKYTAETNHVWRAY